MHELSIVSSLVEKVLDFATEQKVAQVLTVSIAVGELTHLEPEQLKFCYEAVTHGTPLEGSALELETIEAVVMCPHCCYRGRPKYWSEAQVFEQVPTLQCPKCGKQAEASEGNDCAIKTVKFTR
jgi:hydrogenase nickel incorporation protein HypA/HybF